MRAFISDISGNSFPVGDRISGKNIRASLLNFIRLSNPEFTAEKSLSLAELNHFREQYIADFLQQELGALTHLEEKVLKSMHEQTLLSRKPEDEDQSGLTLGQRVADHVAEFGGSWTFIISFGIFLVCWIVMNVWWLNNTGFDPYPFILLNLILSCIAALQAPVIMMSQNRQEEKDRERAKKDYMINLKSELEIRVLHEKMDHLIMHQQQELLEIQQVQIEMMNDIMGHLGKRSGNP